MTPTVAEVIAEIQDLLGDPAGRVFDAALATRGYKRAYRRMRDEMLKCQIPVIARVVLYTVPAGTTSLLPSGAGILDFGELIELAERTPSTSDDFEEVVELPALFNGRAAASLQVFEWRNDTFYFYGATGDRELRIRYYDSGNAPDSGSVAIDGTLQFLSYYGAAAVGPSRGYDSAETLRLRSDAELFLHDLIQPMVRAQQRIQRQPQPYGVGPYAARRVRPSLYIAAPPADIDTVIQQLTITGTQDGINDTFTLSQLPQSLQLFRNGILQYPDVAYTRADTVITFLTGYIPTSIDLLRAEAVV